MKRLLVLAGCGALTLGVTACESTEQESSKIGRESEAAAHATTTPAKKHRGHRHARTRSHRPAAAKKAAG
jgi:hypothetical protein